MLIGKCIEEHNFTLGDISSDTHTEDLLCTNKMNRKEALYEKNIPCFILLKPRDECPACTNFFPIFRELSANQRLDGKVNFVIMSFGRDPVTGKEHHLPKEYQVLIDNNPNVPLLFLHLPNDTIIDLGNGQHPAGRTEVNLLATIVEALKGTEYRV